MAVDAFTINWANLLFYAFPPFSLITKVLQKVEEDLAEGILIVPLWETQAWYPQLMSMLIAHSLLLPRGKQGLFLPFSVKQVYRLHPKLQLMACHLSGNCCKALVFLKKQPISSLVLGEQELRNSTKHTYRSGSFSVVSNRQSIVSHFEISFGFSYSTLCRREAIQFTEHCMVCLFICDNIGEGSSHWQASTGLSIHERGVPDINFLTLSGRTCCFIIREPLEHTGPGTP